MRSRPRPSSLLVRGRHDADAFAAFYIAYSDRVLAFHARRVLDPEVAFDLMSETFAKALERRLQFRGDSAEEEQGWLFTIARSELSRYWHTGRVERAALERWSIVVPPPTTRSRGSRKSATSTSGACGRTSSGPSARRGSSPPRLSSPARTVVSRRARTFTACIPRSSGPS